MADVLTGQRVFSENQFGKKCHTEENDAAEVRDFTNEIADDKDTDILVA